MNPDPDIKDPSNAQNLNRYSYCLNNPLKYTDPSGEDETDDGNPKHNPLPCPKFSNGHGKEPLLEKIGKFFTAIGKALGGGGSGGTSKGSGTKNNEGFDGCGGGGGGGGTANLNSTTANNPNSNTNVNPGGNGNGNSSGGGDKPIPKPAPLYTPDNSSSEDEGLFYSHPLWDNWNYYKRLFIATLNAISEAGPGGLIMPPEALGVKAAPEVAQGFRSVGAAARGSIEGNAKFVAQLERQLGKDGPKSIIKTLNSFD